MGVFLKFIRAISKGDFGLSVLERDTDCGDKDMVVAVGEDMGDDNPFLHCTAGFLEACNKGRFLAAAA